MKGKENDEFRAKAIGGRIALARREADGMTQRVLAQRLNVTERSVASWEAGKVIPYKYMRRLEEILGRSTSWLLYGEGPGNGPAMIGPMELAGQHEEIIAKLDEILALLKKRK